MHTSERNTMKREEMTNRGASLDPLRVMVFPYPKKLQGRGGLLLRSSSVLLSQALTRPEMLSQGH
jgi:hypothetical protein